MEQLDVSPDVRAWAKEKHARNLGWAKGLSELVDNAFDAGAHQVELIFHRDSSVFMARDDGSGADASVLEAMVRPGDHRSRGGVVEYGIGLKDFALWMFGEQVVHSWHRGQLRTISANWPVMTTWKIRPVTLLERSQHLPDARGTAIMIRHPRRRFPNRAEKKSVLEQLGVTYTPALRTGRALSIVTISGGSREVLHASPYADPWDPKTVRSGEVVIDARHRADYRIGMLRDPTSRPNGVNLIYLYRVIESGTDRALGEYSGRGIFMEITLSGEWVLEVNKTKVMDEDAMQVLEQRLHAQIVDLLEAADQRAKDVYANALENRVNHIVGQFEEVEAKGREKRKMANAGGAHPTGTGNRVRRKATRIHTGQDPIIKRRPKLGKLHFHFENAGPGTVGRIVNGRTVYLNADSEFVGSLKRAENEMALATLVFAFKAIDMRHGELFVSDDFSKLMAELIPEKLFAMS